MRVLIAGCGYVGTALGHRLVDDGHDVIATRRDASSLPGRFDRRSLDLIDRAAVDGLPDVDAVAVTVSADARDVAAYRAAYVDTLTTLRASFDGRSSDARLRRWLFTSSTAVYGDTGGGWVDEDTPTDPSSDTGAVLVEAESLVTDDDVDGVAVRLGGIYGPTRTRLVDQVRSGSATCPPDPTYTNRIHRDDIAAICADLLVRDEVPTVLNLVDDDPAERCDVLTWLADQLGVPPPPTGDGGRTRSNKRVSNARLRALGFELEHPSFRSGYAAMLAAGPEN